MDNILEGNQENLIMCDEKYVLSCLTVKCFWYPFPHCLPSVMHEKIQPIKSGIGWLKLRNYESLPFESEYLILQVTNIYFWGKHNDMLIHIFTLWACFIIEVGADQILKYLCIPTLCCILVILFFQFAQKLWKLSSIPWTDSFGSKSNWLCREG